MAKAKQKRSVVKANGIARLDSEPETVTRIAPRSEIEMMLAEQMFATHEAAMECLGRASAADAEVVSRDSDLKHAAKLMAIYERQVAALDKHRDLVKAREDAEGASKFTGINVRFVSPGGRAIKEWPAGGSEDDAPED